ncbi:transposase domain-containing protein [Streptomyces synnematoformans]|uniref:transposase domain-containing protein n=1 Tax=Streptomyces synnematoformans TaxID=415721 RepID=UPI0031D47F59
MVYLLLAGSLFPQVGWRQVRQRLTAGLEGLKVADPTGGALAQARGRVGTEPLRWLIDLLHGPAPGIGNPGVWWRGLLVCAIDGTTMSVPDTPANLTQYTKQSCNNGGAGYPALRLLCWSPAAHGPPSTLVAYQVLRLAMAGATSIRSDI